ncbi:MAG: iron donor protein CyaY [Gammaproteobacteria bacterium]
MKQTSFSTQTAVFLEVLLERLESVDALDDLDMDLIDGVLTLEFPDGAQIIINRQSSAKQIWLASPQGPAHFSYVETVGAVSGEWRNDRDDKGLRDTLNDVLSEKIGTKITLTEF